MLTGPPPKFHGTRDILTISVVGRHPSGSCANRRVTVRRITPLLVFRSWWPGLAEASPGSSWAIRPGPAGLPSEAAGSAPISDTIRTDALAQIEQIGA